MSFEIKDSGERIEYQTGMVRDVSIEKPLTELLIPIDSTFDDTLIHHLQGYRHDVYEQIVFILRGERLSGRSIEMEDVADVMDMAESICTKEGYTMPLSEQVLNYAMHLTKGAKKYSPRNWEKCKGDKEALSRFIESAHRHATQWSLYCEDEDHWSATLFNLHAIAYWHQQENKENDK